MDNQAEVDILIVGAGPAGTSAAISFLKHGPGLSVLIADKSSFPRDKPCGDGLGPGVVSVLELLDADTVVAGEPQIDGVTVFGPAGLTFTSGLPQVQGRDITGYVIPREQFDYRLLRLASDRGAIVRERWNFKSLSTKANGQKEVVFESPDGLKVIHARIVIAADGANSRVRKALGVKRNTDKHLGIAIRAYAKHQPYQGDENKLIFDFSEKLLPAYAWLFPITKTSSNVGLGMIVSEHKKRHAKLDELLTTFAQEFASFGYEIPEISNSRTYLLPHGARIPKLVHDRVVLIGDAGSMVNPLSGEGIFYGMCAGEMLGRMVSPMMGDQIDLTLRAFETEFRKRFAWHFRSNYVASILMRSTLWAKIVVKAAAKDPVVVRDAVELLFGEGTIRPSTTFRILRYGVL